MHLTDQVRNASELLALEPDELGIKILHAIAHQPRSELGNFAGNIQSSQRFNSNWPEVYEAIVEAWCWLEGAAYLVPMPGVIGPNPFRQLSRRAKQIVKENDPRKALLARNLPRDAIHQEIREDVWQLFQRGKYDSAVFAAMKAVEVHVRRASGLAPSDLGTDLMRKAFNPNGGPLSDDAALPGEREARSALFAGSIGSYKNPQSHRHVDLEDPAEAAEINMLASHLLRIVDGRVKAARRDQ